MRRLLLVALLGLVPLAGCGEDDDALSKEEHIAETDRLCRRFETESSELPEPRTEAELQDLLDTAVRLTSQFRDDVADLSPPEEGEDVHEAFLDAIDDTIEKATEARDAAAEGDIEAAGTAFGKAQEAASSVNDRLADYGFEDCAED